VDIGLSWRSIEASEVNAKLKRAIFFPNEEDWGSMGRPRRSDETCARFSSMNLRRAASSSWDKEWIGPKGRAVPLYRVILRLYGRWSANFSGFGFAEHIHKVMIVFGTELMSGCSDVVMEQPVTSEKEIRSLKHSKSSSLLAWEYAAALMRVTIGFPGGYWGTDFRSSGSGS